MTVSIDKVDLSRGFEDSNRIKRMDRGVNRLLRASRCSIHNRSSDPKSL